MSTTTTTKVSHIRVYQDGKPKQGVMVNIDGGLAGETDGGGEILIPADEKAHIASANGKSVQIKSAQEGRIFTIILDPTPVAAAPKAAPKWQFWKKSTPTIAGSGAPKKQWIRWVIFLALAGATLYLLLKPTPYDPSKPIPAWQMPTQTSTEITTTLDGASNPTIGVLQGLYGILLLGILVSGWLNAKERQQIGDFVTAFVSLLSVFLLFAWQPIQVFVLNLFGFPPSDLNQKIVSFGVFTATVTGVTVVSLVGGRDFTAWGVFFGGLALGGAITGKLGVFGHLFQTGSKLVPADLWWNMLRLKDYEAARFTTIIIILFIASLAGYCIDLIKPDRKQKPAWGAVLVAAISPLLYVIVRNKLPQIPPWFISITLIGIVAILATFSRQIGFGASNLSGNPNRGGIGQYITRPSWDVVGLFVVWGGLLLTLTGWV